MRRFLAVVLAPLALFAATPTGYHVLSEIKVGGEGCSFKVLVVGK